MRALLSAAPDGDSGVNLGNANHKNGAKGTTALRRSYADIAAFDPALEAEISRLAKRLGYVD